MPFVPSEVPVLAAIDHIQVPAASEEHQVIEPVPVPPGTPAAAAEPPAKLPVPTSVPEAEAPAVNEVSMLSSAPSPVSTPVAVELIWAGFLRSTADHS